MCARPLEIFDPWESGITEFSTFTFHLPVCGAIRSAVSVKHIWIVTAVASLALAGCQKKTEGPPAETRAPQPLAIEVVKESERSKSFVAVTQQLELGGTIYGYVDIDGDVNKLASSLSEIMAQVATSQPQAAPFLKQDYPALFATLGFNDIKAIGVSSVPDGTGFFRNRAFFYTPGSRHGLLAGLGGKPGPFAHVKLAPADADVFAEGEIDVPAVYQTIKEVIAKVGGETAQNAFEDSLKKAGESAAISLLSLFNGMKGHMSVIVRLDPSRTLALPGSGLTLPAFSTLICLERVGQAIEPALIKSPLLVASQNGAVHIYEMRQPLPLEGVKPIIVIDGDTLYFATTREFYTGCREQSTSLADAPEFKQALTHVGQEGNGLAYVSPRFFSRLRELEKMNPSAEPQMRSMLHLIASRLPVLDRPLVSVRTNLPDGILVRSYMNRSLKQEIAMAAVYNPVSLGVLAAMAIPAFQKVRTASQEKAVINNLRQLSAAAEQYYLENGVSSATYDNLVGPKGYIKILRSIAGEDYRSLRFVQGEPLRVRLSNGKVVEYTP